MNYIIIAIIYYVFSSIIFSKLIDKERIFGLDRFDFIISLIPIIRFIYYICIKFI